MATSEKGFKELLAELKQTDIQRSPQRLLVKSEIVASPKRAGASKQLQQHELGLLLKSAISNAVASGRLSGTVAVRGLQALGLSEDN